MRILITTATNAEADELKLISSDRHQVEFAVTGVGMVATTYYLTKWLTEHKYDLAINCGIAGSFDRSIAIGEVVFVAQDVFSELGAEDDQNFLSLSAMGLTSEDKFSPVTTERFPALNKFKQVRGITVNTVHGNDETIAMIVDRLNPEIETMEGAAFYFICERENIPSIQLRAISNYVEKRNRDAWNIPLAIRSVSEAVKQLINEI
jgi:futalosine hydrolase